MSCLRDRRLARRRGRLERLLHVQVINIGDLYHTFHAHNVAHISLGALDGIPWPANVLPPPGAADTMRLIFAKPGL